MAAVNLYLSSVYQNKKFWIMVYHTSRGSAEVEMITHRLFKSRETAWKWFNHKRVASAFIEPEAIMVSGLDKLIILERSKDLSIRDESKIDSIKALPCQSYINEAVEDPIKVISGRALTLI